MYSCTCFDGTFSSDRSSCEDCQALCTSKGSTMQTCVLNGSQSTTALIAGVSVAIFLGFLVVTIVVWALLIWFSVHVIRKCRGKPAWLKPTLIALLVLIFLMGWVPGLGLLLLVGLLVLLIVYNNTCIKR